MDHISQFYSTKTCFLIESIYIMLSTKRSTGQLSHMHMFEGIPLHSSHTLVKHQPQGLWPVLMELMLCKGLHFLPVIIMVHVS